MSAQRDATKRTKLQQERGGPGAPPAIAEGYTHGDLVAEQKGRCFGCDGTGSRCNVCGESGLVCKCEEFQESPCSDCGGSGR